MEGLPDRKVTEEEVESLRQSTRFDKVVSGHRYIGTTDSVGFSRLEITLRSGKTEELIYAGEEGEWITITDTHPGDTGFWECEACGKEIWGERAEPPHDHTHDCEEAGVHSLSFREDQS